MGNPTGMKKHSRVAKIIIVASIVALVGAIGAWGIRSWRNQVTDECKLEAVAGVGWIRSQLRMRIAFEGDLSGLPTQITGGQFIVLGIEPASLDGECLGGSNYRVDISGDRYIITATDPQSGLKYQLDQNDHETRGKGFFTTE